MTTKEEFQLGEIKIVSLKRQNISSLGFEKYTPYPNAEDKQFYREFGKCEIVEDVLIISDFRIDGPPAIGNELDIFNSEISELPKWSATKYFLVYDRMDHLYFCENGEVVPNPEAYKILSKISFYELDSDIGIFGNFMPSFSYLKGVTESFKISNNLFIKIWAKESLSWSSCSELQIIEGVTEDDVALILYGHAWIDGDIVFFDPPECYHPCNLFEQYVFQCFAEKLGPWTKTKKWEQRY